MASFSRSLFLVSLYRCDFALHFKAVKESYATLVLLES